MSLQNQVPGPERTAAQHLAAFGALLRSLAGDHRQSLMAFWRDVRRSLNDQDAIIAVLQQPSLPAVSPPRPHTSNSVQAIRDTVSAAILNESLQADDASNTIEEISDLDPTWALDFIRRHKNLVLCAGHELGCWVSGNANAHDNGYVKMNLRGTIIPGTSRRFAVQPFGHQMGIVAGGSGPTLRLTTNGEFHVSHLCHNTACFNPEHLVVEQAGLNRLRNSCKHSFIIRTVDGTVIHPCTHWRGDRRLQCILPRRSLPPACQGQWVDMTPQGPVIRTGRSNQ